MYRNISIDIRPWSLTNDFPDIFQQFPSVPDACSQIQIATISLGARISRRVVIERTINGDVAGRVTELFDHRSRGRSGALTPLVRPVAFTYATRARANCYHRAIANYAIERTEGRKPRDFSLSPFSDREIAAETNEFRSGELLTRFDRVCLSQERRKKSSRRVIRELRK